MPVTLWAVLWVGEITSAAAWNPEHVVQVWRNTAIESPLFMSIRWQSIRINASLLWTRSLGMAEARAAFGLPPMSPSLWASQSLTLILLTRFCQGSQVMCIQVSRSSLVCHSGGKTLALVVEVLREAQISIFTLRDRADPARYHSRCDKCLCKLDDSHTFCKGLLRLWTLWWVRPCWDRAGFWRVQEQWMWHFLAGSSVSWGTEMSELSIGTALCQDESSPARLSELGKGESRLCTLHLIS